MSDKGHESSEKTAESARACVPHLGPWAWNRIIRAKVHSPIHLGSVSEVSRKCLGKVHRPIHLPFRATDRQVSLVGRLTMCAC